MSATNLPRTADSPDPTLRCATYNLLHGRSLATGAVDIGAVTAAIATLEVDLVAVQEADRAQSRSGRTHQVAAIASALGWHWAFASALLGDPDRRWTSVPPVDPGGAAYGVGLLSRRRLTGVTRITLPGGGEGRRRREASPQRPGWDREPRVALAADVGMGARSLRVVTTHLSYLPWRGARQLRRAARAAGKGPAVLLGDLNLPPGPVELVLGRRWTTQTAGPTYPAPQPRVRLDHILATGGAQIAELTVAVPATSDHRPLVGTVVLAPSTR